MSNNPEHQWAIALLCKILLTDNAPENRILAAQTLLKLKPIPTKAMNALTFAALKDQDAIVRGKIIQAIQTYFTVPETQTMPEEPKVQMTFNAPVYGAAGNVEGDQVIHSQDADFNVLLEDYKQFIHELEQQRKTPNSNPDITTIIDVEFRPLAKIQPQRWQRFLTLKQLWNGGKKATLKIGEHFTEESLVGKAAIAFLDGVLEDS